jgi:hypothetical protein
VYRFIKGWCRETETTLTIILIKQINMINKNKIILPFLFLVLLSNCVTPTASLFGPAVTGLKSGSIYQSGFSYASNNIIEKKLGISPTKFITKFLDENLDKSESESTFIDTGNRKKETKNIKFVQNLKDIENEHNNFVKAVKKMLK